MVDENNNLIDYSIEDIMKGVTGGTSLKEVEEKIKNNENFRRVILYLGLSFFNHQNNSVTIREINEKIIRKSHSYPSKLLDYLVLQEFLHKTLNKRTNQYSLNLIEKDTFKSLVELAKKIQFGGKNAI